MAVKQPNIQRSLNASADHCVIKFSKSVFCAKPHEAGLIYSYSLTDGNNVGSVWGMNFAAEKRFMNSWFTFNSI